MLDANRQKIKLLKLVELLWKETDEKHPMATMTIISRLEQMGISCERRTLAKDVAVLNEYGFHIDYCWVNREKAYYAADRLFSTAELRSLIEAVRESSSSMIQERADALIDKLSVMDGIHKKQDLLLPLRDTEEYSIDMIKKAIRYNQRIRFRYVIEPGADNNNTEEQIVRYCFADPVVLMDVKGTRYVIVRNQRLDRTDVCRADHMHDVSIIADNVCERTLELRSQYERYIELTQRGGEERVLLLYFNKEMLNSVRGHFRGRVTLLANDEEMVVLAVKVELSPDFWNWAFRLGPQMQVIFPEEVIDLVKVKAQAEKEKELLQQTKDNSITELAADEIMVERMADSFSMMDEAEMANWTPEAAADWVHDEALYAAEHGTKPLQFDADDVYDTIGEMVQTEKQENV